jgi:hypothetical protein
MVIEWTLVNHRNRTMYELGKGPLYEVMRPTSKDAPIFLYRETFVPHFVKFCKEGWSSSFDPTDPQYWTWYWTRLGNTIFDFIDGCDPEKDLKIISDTTDDIVELREQGYIYLGSRYYIEYNDRYEVGEGIDYNDWLKILNRRSKTSIDISKIDYTWPISRIRKLLIFC